MAARQPWDVIVVGGGPAGLSAALMLGRCLRRVLVCDSGPKRNQASRALHGFLTRDGLAPAELLAIARAQLRRYSTVERRQARVTGLRRRGPHFEATLSRGRRVTARRVLLATGVVDQLPRWPGLDRFYGRSVFHCPYCDGWEFRGRRLAAWGRTSATAGLALKLTSWSRRVTLLTGGRYRLAPRVRARLARAGVQVREEPVVRLGGRAGALRRVVVAGGLPVPATRCSSPCPAARRATSRGAWGAGSPGPARCWPTGEAGRTRAASTRRATRPSTRSWWWSPPRRARGRPSPSTRNCSKRTCARNHLPPLDFVHGGTSTVRCD